MHPIKAFNLLLIFAACSIPLFGDHDEDHLPFRSPAKIRMLYNSLEPQSIIQHLALHSLYPQTPYGQKALQDACKLLKITQNSTTLKIPKQTVHNLVQLFNLTSNTASIVLSPSDIELVQTAGDSLPNRLLKGHSVSTEGQVMDLTSEEIDLARAVFLSQLGDEPEALQKMRSYEAMLDLMALQVLARLPPNPTPQQIIREMNRLIFEEMQFRFPPHSVYTKDIDLYTFLPSVLDSRRGVCLGVSILYLCLAQRLNLQLEMITPPGHIYIRYHQGNEIINIETTARGIDVQSEEYLGVNTRSLEERTLKEVIGLAYINQAANDWQNEHYEKALSAYQQAGHYLSEDKQLKEFTAYMHLMLGQENEARPLLEDIRNHLPEHQVSMDTIAADFLDGNVDVEGIKAVFMHVDEDRDSLIKKRNRLQNVVEKHPKFRCGYMLLGITWMQLHRAGEALEAFQQYHTIDPRDANIEYYLAELLAERWDYENAWSHLKNAEILTAERKHTPKALVQLRRTLQCHCPE